jgi:hypothetical protein
MTSTVSRSALRTAMPKRLTSRTWSPSGENARVAPRSSTTGVAPFRRWATKNAPNVAPTRSRKTATAARVNAWDYGV